MFDSVLVANRGEIAVRVIRALRSLGIRSVAVYSDADAEALHVRLADEAVRIGPAAARESYLSIEKIVAAAVSTGAQAIHPGYGFLAENTAFAAACSEAGIVFVGPPASAIDAMGDKIRAKLTVSAAGVPVVPGRTRPDMSDDEIVEAALEIGFPVLLKPSAGGGGKGMRLVHEESALREAIESARREARGSFGDDTLLIERFITNPRHIEIQVLGDAHGTVIHLGERECSLQRRHQKIIEEAPSPFLTPEVREAMGSAAVDAAKAVGYVGAGTVEFIVDGASGDYFFMEMNTRLQVEHPVTEMVTGVDLVEWQLRVASGEELDLQVELNGHSVEARVYAEDPARGFLPTGGRVLALSEPTDVRVDSGLYEGLVVGSDYDPMLAKVIAHGRTREEALRRLDHALGRMVLLGVTTNIPFLRALLRDEDVRSGALDTGLVERKLDSLTSAEIPDDVYVAAGLERSLQPHGDDPWDQLGGWRVGEHAWTTWRINDVDVRVRGEEVAVGAGEPVRARARREGADLLVGSRRYAMARDGDVLWLGHDGASWALVEAEFLVGAAVGAAASGGPVKSPMPGTVLVVRARQGEEVTAGQALFVVEAMKMEHTVTAPVDGVLAEVNVQAGQQVALDQVLALVVSHEE
ncbi:acetyl-CoA/propionyl-CoA carboxylase, biotin carboxylase, biotin carboxyl carrier protein [Lentzea albidocapillata subsp. violacea]|uniref:Biotin-dependent 3-methylcrotonyl-coenzyme A carboxylase alpha1 subunit n=1 Tax=Lentzea albidocapillata subsp. violacea TaxID=128104 RepID=A0A1G8X6G5_9PSEU|nr:acetyl/propionyl/methylcrotonyl-CoA carboxylase subunit alpha [Lentzea albidocapillata]SDJ86133.1 acetyl-CoA/propionyl-CoA carboxylase, biotin carboxylase, biotin carboxyl carrier protein [Lentzea albidocapillata subsp. violacea]